MEFEDDLINSTAALRGCSIKDLVLHGVQAELEGRKGRRKRKAIRLPIIDSQTPGWLQLTNRRINEILFP